MKDPALEDLRQLLRQEIPRLRQVYKVRSLWVFGSRVRQQGRPTSDLDVLVEFDKPPSLIRFIEMEQELSLVLGVKVDLVSKGSLRRRRGDRILDEARPV